MFVDHCVAQHLGGKLDAATASMAKYWLTELQGEIVDACVQLHGGYGFMDEYEIARGGSGLNLFRSTSTDEVATLTRAFSVSLCFREIFVMQNLLLSAAMWAVLGAPVFAQTFAIPPGMSADVAQQIDVISQDKAQRTPAQRKMDATLIYAARDAAGLPQFPNAPAMKLPQLSQSVGLDASGQVLVDIKTSDANGTADQIRARGGTIVSALPEFRAVRANVAIATIEAIAALPAVVAVRKADLGFSNGAENRRAAQRAENVREQISGQLGNADGANAGRGTVISEAVVAHGADVVQDKSGINGAGTRTKICVMSDGVNSLAAKQAAGELPNVTVLSGQAGNGDEGTAMLELIADMAPGAQLTYATAQGGKAQMAANIYTLTQSASCNIMVDDFTYAQEAAFQEDVVANAVTNYVDGQVNGTNVYGIFFSSAGNSGRKNAGRSGTWEGDYVQSTDRVGFGNNFVHNFGTQLYATLSSVGRGIDLQWSDPQDASANDFDLYLVNAAGNTLIWSSTNTQSGTGNDPFESISCNDGSNRCAVGQRIYIIGYAVGSTRALRLDASRGEIFPSTDGSIFGHNGSKNSVSVAAVAAPRNPTRKFVATDTVETFSSDGPRRLFLNPVPSTSPITPNCYTYSCNGGTILQKPDIAAADRVSTSVGPDFLTFTGTSAAAPNAAAIAALIKQRAPSLVGSQILARMKATAIDLAPTGVDRDSGAGIVMADAAVLGLRIGQPHDFNHDFKADILWRNTGGDVYLWTMNGATVSGVAGVGSVATNWTIWGQRDFNGDGNVDILWGNTSGNYVIWFMNGSTVATVASLGTVAPNWTPVGTGDFNGDNNGDILWRNSAGDTAIWFMNGATVLSTASLGNVPSNWFVAGVADFNANLRSDILWRNSTGDNAIWFMNGASVASVLNLGNIATNWSIVGTGNFNNNSPASNILWRNTAGDTAIWYFNNGAVSQIFSLGNVPTTWSVASVGDFDSNSAADILWRNSGGANAIWFFNNSRVSAITNTGGVATNWSVQSAGAN